jgi:hypothetical protein
MLKKLALYTLCAAIAILFLAVVVGSADRRDEVIGYNVMAERVFIGSAESKPYILDQLMYFPLKTEDSVVLVQIGPKDFVERSHFKINAGEVLTVTGMPIEINRRNVVLAREVRSVSGVFTVRDAVGLPRWDTDGPFQMDPERHKTFLDVCEIWK